MLPGVAQWQALMERASAATGVPVAVIAAVMSVESGGDARAHNASGATGLMQIMPSVWNKDGKLNLYDPYTNILKGAQILAMNYKAYGDWNETFQRYYGVGNRQVSAAYAAKVGSYLNSYGGAGTTPNIMNPPREPLSLSPLKPLVQPTWMEPYTYHSQPQAAQTTQPLSTNTQVDWQQPSEPLAQSRPARQYQIGDTRIKYSTY